MKFKYSNKKVLIFCPHQDDEINIAGGLIPVLKEKSCDVKVVYSTNGDYFVDKKYRFKEVYQYRAISSIRKRRN